MAKNRKLGSWPEGVPNPAETGQPILGWTDTNGEQHYGKRTPDNKSDDPIFDNLSTDMSPQELLEQIIKNRMNTEDANHDRDDAYLNLWLQLLLRDQDFQRSSPQAQIERLMSVGMSRSAAIQALQEQQYGSVQPTMAGNLEQTELAKQQQQLAMAQGILSMVGQVVECGLQIGASIPAIQHTMQATQALSLQNQQTKLFGEAHMAIGRYMQAFDNVRNYTAQDLPDNLTDAVALGRNSPFSGSFDSWESDISNPFFYPAMRKAFREQVMDKYELANELQTMKDLAKIRDLDIQQATTDLWSAISDWNVQVQTEQDRIDISHNSARISSSQATMAENDEYLSSVDREFWTPEKRKKFLQNHTELEYYQRRLAQLNVEYQETVNKDAVEEFNRKMQLYAELGPSFIKQQAENLMQNEKYRNVVLQVAQIQIDRQLQTLENLDNMTDWPLTDGWFAHKFVAISDFFNAYKVTGLLDYAIKFAAVAAK